MSSTAPDQECGIDDPVVDRLRELAPFSYDYVVTDEQKAALRQQLVAIGMRELPWPFTHIVTVMSDTDRSNRDIYAAYMGCIVRRHGLDFGDSVWLETIEAPNPGGAFFRPDLRTRRVGSGTDLGLGFFELLREHHLGNIDHWHSFLVRGPRFLPLRFQARDDVLHAELAPERQEANPVFNSRHFPLFGIVLLSPNVSGLKNVKVALIGKEGETSFAFKRDDDTERRLSIANPGLSLAVYAPEIGESEVRFPSLDGIDAIELSGALRDRIVQAFALNYTREPILAALSQLESFGFSVNAITAHAEWHFHTPEGYRQLVVKTREWIGRNGPARDSYHALPEHSGIAWSTLADDPASFGYVMDAAVNRFGARFIRIRNAATDGGSGVNSVPDGKFDCFDFVRPALSRDGATIVYAIQGTTPSISPHEQPESGVTRTKTVARNFASRLDSLLERLKELPGTVHAIHTHLGNLEPRSLDIPDPYFPDRVMGRLVDAANGCVPSCHPWFTRLGVASAYALCVQLLPEHVVRHEDHIDIMPAYRKLVAREFPSDACELYGVTFTVADPIAAVVKLDGKLLSDLIRYHGDDGEDSFVTIAAPGIRRVVFDELDPARTTKVSGLHCEWRWRSGDDAWSGRGFGEARISRPRSRWSWTSTSVGAGGRSAGSIPEDAMLSIALPAGSLEGATIFAFSVRKTSPEVRFGLILQTDSGAKFGFGERDVLERISDLAGRYRLDRHFEQPFAAGQWTRIVVPFHLLDWSSPPSKISARPNHPLKFIQIVMRGPDDGGIDLDCMEFGRPKPTWPVRDSNLIVIGGRCADGKAGHTVTARVMGSEVNPSRSTISESGGWFVFPDSIRGAYSISVADRPPVFHEFASSSLDVVV